MQSTNVRHIKAAIRDQAFIGNTCVSSPMGRVVAKRREEGAEPFDDTRWYPVDSVSIAYAGRTLLS